MKKFVNFIQNFEKYFCAVLLVIMLAICAMQVIMRYVFLYTFSWSEELARYLFVWLVFVAGSYAYKENAHIKVDVLIRIFPRPARKYVRRFGILLMVVFLAYTTYLGARYVDTFAKMGQIALGLKIPMSWVYAAIPVGFFMMTLRNVITLFSPLKDEADDVPQEAAELLEEMELAAAAAPDGAQAQQEEEGK